MTALADPGTDIRQLMRYTAWADARLLQALQALPTEVLHTPRLALLGGALDVMGHCLLIDQVWRAHLEQRAHGFASRIPQVCTPLAQLLALQAESDRWYTDYADALDAQRQQEVLRFDFIDGGSGAMSRGDILLHVANHKTFHRGCVVVLIDLAGHRPPVLDLPVFLRDGVPCT
jgi:uncharacterized damage-inducible protein DinB